MKFPKFLPDGGTIGFVAPSFGCATSPYQETFEHAQKRFTELGYRLDLGPNCYESSGIGISNTPEKCAQELVDYYVKSDNDCLISCGGGELMCEILPYMDFDRLAKADPKWYMGYSDNTNMTYLLATLADTASIYGPCAGAFGMELWHPAISDAFHLLTGRAQTVSGYPLWEKEALKDETNPLAPYHVTEPRVLRCYGTEYAQRTNGTTHLYNDQLNSNPQLAGGNLQTGAVSPASAPSFHVSGRLLGGCMDCLVNLTGTRFDKTKDFIERYKEDGIIWFLEACDLNVFSIRRAMWQMEQAGWFEHVKAFLIGRPLCFGQDMMGLDPYQAVLPVALSHHVPVIMDVDLGHLPPMMPLIVGSLADVTVSGNDIRIDMQLR